MFEISQSYEGDAQVGAITAEATTNQQGPHIYQYSAGILKKNGKLYIGSSGGLRQQLISAFHDSPVGGHSGQLGTLKRLSQVFFWPGMKQMIINYIAVCEVCQRNKGENVQYPGILQPLPIPDQAWRHINMDFIEGLPKSKGKEVILVVVDRRTKYAHFMTLAHPFTAVTVAH